MPGKPDSKQIAQAARLLAAAFQRNGCFRLPPSGKSGATHKGYEARLFAATKSELVRLRRCLILAGFKPAKPWPKRKQFVQPLYGKKPVIAFKRLVARRAAPASART